MHASLLIDEVIATTIKPCLQRTGFQKRGFTFYRDNGDLFEIISVQKSQWNSADEASLTVNLGVYWPSIQQVLGRVSTTIPPKEYECTVRSRIGPLFASGNDYWWTVSLSSDSAAIGRDVGDKIEQYGYPWLTRASSPTDVVPLLPPPARVVLLAQLGRISEARELLTTSIGKSQHAKGLFERLATKLSLATVN